MQFSYLSVAMLVIVVADNSFAQDSADKTRVGTCDDAKSQMEYFCDPEKAEKDSMVAIGTACENAKNNVKEACEGVVQEDAEYKFDQK